MNSSVLVVENYADLRSAILAALARHDVVCDSALDPADAVAKLTANDYQTILLAPTLPIRSDAVMRYLADHRPADLAKVVLMREPDDADDDASEQDCRMLLKPFGSEELFAEVDAAS